MEFKGTKGLKILSSNEFGFGIGGDFNNFRLTVWGADEESKANALLISKAPEMLEMLERILKDNVIPNLDISELIKQATEL